MSGLAAMNQPREYAATSIGAWAYDIWRHAQAAAVIGVTSRGLFLRAAPDRILFLSYESKRGPLTITVPPSLRALFAKQSSEIGAMVRFSANRLFFPSIEVTLSISEDVIWQAPAPITPILSPEAIKATLRSIADEIVAQRHVEGFGALLVPLLDRSVPPPADQAMLFAELASLRASLTQQSPHAADDAIKLLGRGRGLTPSGDDSVLGLLLMLNRWRVVSVMLRSVAPAWRAAQPMAGTRRSAPPTRCVGQGVCDEASRAAGRDSSARKDALQNDTAWRGSFSDQKRQQVEWLAEFNQRVIEAAYQKTTTLSANLIECAANGEADERLITVADGIMTGEPSVAECVECVLDWGSSSGIDALVGMALAFFAINSS